VAHALRWRRTLLWSSGAFLALALLVRFAGLLPGEQLLYDTIVGWSTPTWVVVFKVIGTLGAWQFLLPATLLLILLGPDEARRHWWLWAAVMVLAPIAEGVCKELVARPRPGGRSFGFPSGHVTAATAYFSLLAYVMSQRLGDRAFRLWTAAWVAVALVAVARIVQRAHWPVDLLGGAALGLAIASAAFWWDEQHAQGEDG
jgi:undecaprenyl-diphosphatase